MGEFNKINGVYPGKVLQLFEQPSHQNEIKNMEKLQPRLIYCGEVGLPSFASPFILFVSSLRANILAMLSFSINDKQQQTQR